MTVAPAPTAARRVLPPPPPGVLEAGRYTVRFARDRADLEAVQRLRFEVFNVELGEGLDEAWETGRDADEFDGRCHHLMVIERGSGRVVGTYRMQTLEMAGALDRFYSAGEFDLGQLPGGLTGGAAEVGRACVAPEHRTGRVMHLLWRGLARYMVWSRRRYLFGCCSVTSQDPDLGRRLHRTLADQGALHPRWWACPLPALSCGPGHPAEEAADPSLLPALLAGYLRLGARVCGGPALDARFKTIDFLVVFDLEALDGGARRRFTDPRGWEGA